MAPARMGSLLPETRDVEGVIWVTSKYKVRPDMVNGSLCNLFALAFLRASFSLLHRADGTQPGRNSCPWLQPYLIGFCRVGVSESQLFLRSQVRSCSLLYVCSIFLAH